MITFYYNMYTTIGDSAKCPSNFITIYFVSIGNKNKKINFFSFYAPIYYSSIRLKITFVRLERVPSDSSQWSLYCMYVFRNHTTNVFVTTLNISTNSTVKNMVHIITASLV